LEGSQQKEKQHLRFSHFSLKRKNKSKNIIDFKNNAIALKRLGLRGRHGLLKGDQLHHECVTAFLYLRLCCCRAAKLPSD